MKKIWLTLIVIGIVLVLVMGLIFFNKIKSIKADCCNLSNSSEFRAKQLYNESKMQGIEFNSQCLGIVSGYDGIYVVDIVHVPRISEDDLAENQCEAYRNGSVSHYIELDKDGKLVMIA